jgi:DNA-binding MarR family transcriptional regulator
MKSVAPRNGGSDGNPDPSLAIYDLPGFLVRRMQQISLSIFFEEARDFDITPLQYAILSATAELPGIDQIGVGGRVGLDRTTVVGIVDRLERKGLIKRRTDKNDRRVRKLILTDAGQQLLQDMTSAVRRIQMRILEPLSNNERTIFVKYLKRVVCHHNGDVRVPINDRDTRATVTG